MIEIFNILHILPVVLTILYFCCSSIAHEMVRRIYKDDGLFATVITVMLCIGCWQLFWIIHFNPSIAKKLSR
jgi:hypothetical protein